MAGSHNTNGLSAGGHRHPCFVMGNTRQPLDWNVNRSGDQLVAAFLGFALGDALGVPYEFRSREQMHNDPCTTMTGYRAHKQAPGTWSDDTSLAMCLAASLAEGDYDIKDIARKCIAWRDESYWTARGEVFGIGKTTSASLSRLKEKLDSGDKFALFAQTEENIEMENGNGSLMRILPLLFHLKEDTIKNQWEKVREVSALTHRHIRAHMCCLIYLRVGEMIFNGKTIQDGYDLMREDIRVFWDEIAYPEQERAILSGLITDDISERKQPEIGSSGYVVDSLEAALWCLLTTTDYQSAVLKAVNLGGDTDTIAALTGGLAGLHYGLDALPAAWLEVLARREDIEALAIDLRRFC